MALRRATGPAVDVVEALSRVISDQLKKPEIRLRPLVVCGPSGVGKSFTIRKLIERFHPLVRETVSTTTRAPRGAERDGVEYHFVSRKQFEAGVRAGKFIEHDTIHGNMYGMTAEEVIRVHRAGCIAIMDVTMQGASELADACSIWQNNLGVPPPYVAFIAPPSMEDLERQLRSRKTETEEQVQRRLAQATHELTDLFEKYADIFNVVLKKKWT